MLEGRSASDWGLERRWRPSGGALLTTSAVLTQPHSIQNFFMGTFLANEAVDPYSDIFHNLQQLLFSGGAWRRGGEGCVGVGEVLSQ